LKWWHNLYLILPQLKIINVTSGNSECLKCIQILCSETFTGGRPVQISTMGLFFVIWTVLCNIKMSGWDATGGKLSYFIYNKIIIFTKLLPPYQNISHFEKKNCTKMTYIVVWRKYNLIIWHYKCYSLINIKSRWDCWT
jgi:hypothetical protein